MPDTLTLDRTLVGSLTVPPRRPAPRPVGARSSSPSPSSSRSRSRSNGATAATAPVRLTRRGRLTVLIVGVVTLFLLLSAGRVWSNAASGKAGPATHSVVVAPGDTLWSLARAALPHMDGRDAVDRLLAMNHSDGTIQVGETLIVPGR